MPKPVFHYAVLHFREEEKEEIREFLSWVNETDGPLEILVDSDGGNHHMMLWILGVLNNPYNQNRITLHAGKVYSAGMILFLGFEGEVRSGPLSQGMVHMGEMLVPTRDAGRVTKTGSRYFDELGKGMAWVSENYVRPWLGVAPEFHGAFEHTHDVWIGPETMAKIVAEKNRKRQEKLTNDTKKIT